jgi:hypothetical protein
MCRISPYIEEARTHGFSSLFAFWLVDASHPLSQGLRQNSHVSKSIRVIHHQNWSSVSSTQNDMVEGVGCTKHSMLLYRLVRGVRFITGVAQVLLIVCFLRGNCCGHSGIFAVTGVEAAFLPFHRFGGFYDRSRLLIESSDFPGVRQRRQRYIGVEPGVATMSLSPLPAKDMATSAEVPSLSAEPPGSIALVNGKEISLTWEPEVEQRIQQLYREHCDKFAESSGAQVPTFMVGSK